MSFPNKASNTLDAFHGGQSVGATSLSSGTNYSPLYSGDPFTVLGKLADIAATTPGDYFVRLWTNIWGKWAP